MQELAWFKFYADFFDDNRTRYLMKQKDGHSMILLFQILMTIAAKCNSGGLIYFTKTMPYTPKLLSTLFEMDITLVRRALKELIRLEYLTETANGFLKITSWESEQYTPPSTEATPQPEPTALPITDINEIVREYHRNKKRQQRTKTEQEANTTNVSGTSIEAVRDMSGTENSNVRDMSGTNHSLYKDKDKDKDKDIEKDKEKEKDKDREAEEEKEMLCRRVADAFNTACASFPKIKFLSEKQKTAIIESVECYGFEAMELCFELTEKSSFLKGQNKKKWVATFDWLIDKNNMTKVLNGNYSEEHNGDNPEQQKESGLIESFVSDEFIEAALNRGWG